MILTCPQCATRYLLPADSLAPEGRRVKCTNCAEVWFQLPDEDELYASQGGQYDDIPDSVKPLPEGSSLPAIPEFMADEEEETPRRRVNVPKGYLASGGVFAGVLGLLLLMPGFFMKAWPATTVFYETIGYDVQLPGDGLAFDKIRAEAVSGEHGDAIKVQGLVINLTKELREVPVIEASLQDAGGATLESWVVEMPEGALAGESAVPFTSDHQAVVQNGEKVNVRFVLKSGEQPKTAAEDAGNTQALHPGDRVLPHGDAEGGESPVPSSAPPHQESSP
jgi:predicted Zn finger-like uncharacterized protein